MYMQVHTSQVRSKGTLYGTRYTLYTVHLHVYMYMYIYSYMYMYMYKYTCTYTSTPTCTCTCTCIHVHIHLLLHVHVHVHVHVRVHVHVHVHVCPRHNRAYTMHRGEQHSRGTCEYKQYLSMHIIYTLIKLTIGEICKQ